MSDVERPTDLISTSEAAKMAERSERTIRRWAQPDVGKLSRWLGQPAIQGGAAPVLVSKRELMVMLAATAQEPRTAGRKTPQVVSRDIKDDPLDMGGLDNRTASPDVRVAVLEEQLRSAELKAELAAVKAERDGVRAVVTELHDQVAELKAQLEEQRRRWDLDRADHRADLDAERDRAQALAAELGAMRSTQGGSWWRKLLGGPVAAIPEAK